MLRFAEDDTRKMIKGAEIVLRCVRAEGVDLVFGYPGGAIMPLYDALEGSGIRHVLTRHEQGAVFAAEGYAPDSTTASFARAESKPACAWGNCAGRDAWSSTASVSPR